MTEATTRRDELLAARKLMHPTLSGEAKNCNGCCPQCEKELAELTQLTFLMIELHAAEGNSVPVRRFSRLPVGKR